MRAKVGLRTEALADDGRSTFALLAMVDNLRQRMRAKVGAGARTRTEDLLITNQLLYQLSYAGMLAGPAIADGRKPLF